MNNNANGPSGQNSNILTFDEATGCTTITLEQLGRTMKLEGYKGKMPKSTPVEHVAVLHSILDLAANAGLTPTLEPITVKGEHSRRLMWPHKDQPCPVENYLIERLVTKIEFKDDVAFANTPSAAGDMAVAVAYTDKGGIQVAFGHNVFACSNMNIFGENMWSTTGGNKLEYAKGMELLRSWLQNYDEKREMTRDRIAELMNTVIDEHTRQRVIGTLFERAVRTNHGDRDAIAPLNQSDCAAMIRAGYDRIVNPEEVITAWDLTNWCTGVLKPDRSDMSGLLIANHRINEFLYQELCVN